jgi:hypothetical protein
MAAGDWEAIRHSRRRKSGRSCGVKGGAGDHHRGGHGEDCRVQLGVSYRL